MNIVPVLKKDGRARVYIDYRDLNKDNLKNNFPLPHIGMLANYTTRHIMFLSMKEFSRNNQIKNYDVGHILIHSYALQIDEPINNLPNGDGDTVP